VPTWWEAGLPFACTRCGKCCHARGEVSHVAVGRREQEDLARHLGLELPEFQERFTEADEAGYRGLRFEGGRCVFLRGAECSVHAAKPVQCRTWPFWPELLRSREAYAREVQSFCPGSVRGALVPAAEIRRQLRELAASERAKR
jgi:Fe-S-cluster containining protein